MKQFTLLVVCSVMMPFSQASNNIRDAHQVSISEAQDTLKFVAKAARLTELRDALANLYGVVPKNEHGLLDHQTVRYVLHRVFLQRHGWYIKGLAPNETQTWHHERPAKSEDAQIKEWVPSFLQDQLEQASTQGTDLEGLAVLVATLEQLVRNEVHDRIAMVYPMHGWTKGPLIDAQTHDLIHTFFLSFLMAGRFEWNSTGHVKNKETAFARKYPSYEETMIWMQDLELKHRGEIEGSFGTEASVERLALRIGEEYYKYQDADCRAMKHTLMTMESKKAGRVRLSTFYRKANFSGFKFNESPEYLKALGAIDDSDPSNLQVLIPNYVLSRPNCLEQSSIYAICCSNECEDLVSNIESHFQSSLAEPSQIVDLVSKLSTDTVQAPRTLDPEVVSRLEQLASQHHGKVPLHGRLFAQWMHHAFPRECPYPQKSGSSSQLTPWEWIASSGKADSEASSEEMQRIVDDAVCEVDSEGKPKGNCTEDESLPWSDEEELLGSYTTVLQDASKSSQSKRQQREGLFTSIAVAVAQFCLVMLYLDYRRARKANLANKVLYTECISGKDVEKKLANLKKATVLGVLSCATLAFSVSDSWVIVGAACSYIVALAVRAYAGAWLHERFLHLSRSLGYTGGQKTV